MRSLRTPYGSTADPHEILTVVIAPDSFKGSLASIDVAAALAEGWRSVRPNDLLHLVPLADGGEGTLDAIAAAVPDAVTRDAGTVRGPDGRPVRGRWLELPGRVAVVELAQMSGLPLMGSLDPLGASTFGLGEVIRSAIDAGMRRIIVGLGGSASTDGGAGALAALGLRGAVDGRPAALDAGGAALAALTSLDRSGLITPPPDGLLLLTDVTAPLLGPRGAAAVFGPQKGATPADVQDLDAALANFDRVLGFAELLGSAESLGAAVDEPGTGAAGGTAFGLASALGATITPGAQYLAELAGVSDLIGRADVLITGEGRFDETSLTGKLVGQLIAVADRTRTPVCLIAGSLEARGPTGFAASLVDLAGSLEAALAEPRRWLRLAGAEAAQRFPSTPPG
ncbi:glycerate kinase [soil metagenome]